MKRSCRLIARLHTVRFSGIANFCCGGRYYLSILPQVPASIQRSYQIGFLLVQSDITLHCCALLQLATWSPGPWLMISMYKYAYCTGFFAKQQHGASESISCEPVHGWFSAGPRRNLCCNSRVVDSQKPKPGSKTWLWNDRQLH